MGKLPENILRGAKSQVRPISLLPKPLVFYCLNCDTKLPTFVTVNLCYRCAKIVERQS